MDRGNLTREQLDEILRPLLADENGEHHVLPGLFFSSLRYIHGRARAVDDISRMLTECFHIGCNRRSAWSCEEQSQ